MIRVSIPNSELKALQRRIEQASDKQQKRISKAVKETTLEVHKTVIESISKPGSGITRKLYLPNRTHTASSPNNPPATDTGNLKQNIRWESKAGEMTGRVISGARYSAALEFGYQANNLEKRPFMRPALEKHFRPFINRVKQVLK